jgi:K+-sensing histidine kinase KdpD
MAEQKPAAPKAMPAILRYGLAVGSVALGTVAAFFLDNYHFRGVEYPLFLFAIAMTVWYAGVGPAILAVVLSSLFFNYYFTEPRFSFYVTRTDVPYYLMFILFALVLTWFTRYGGASSSSCSSPETRCSEKS